MGIFLPNSGNFASFILNVRLLQYNIPVFTGGCCWLLLLVNSSACITSCGFAVDRLSRRYNQVLLLYMDWLKFRGIRLSLLALFVV